MFRNEGPDHFLVVIGGQSGLLRAWFEVDVYGHDRS
jgi:hypothetical protein